MAAADLALSVASPLTSSVTPKLASGSSTNLERDGAKLTEFERELIFVDMMHTLGLPKSYGEIYGLLYATPEPLGFAEIHERLPLSKGSVSGGVKALKEIGAIKSVLHAEDRRERYEPQLELKKLVLAYMRERLQPQLQRNAARMSELKSNLHALELTQKNQKILHSRLEKLEIWRHKAQGLIPWVARFLGK